MPACDCTDVVLSYAVYACGTLFGGAREYPLCAEYNAAALGSGACDGSENGSEYGFGMGKAGAPASWPSGYAANWACATGGGLNAAGAIVGVR